MSLTANIKLKLSKITKSIVVKYNTFEKASYDEYLIASLVLHSKTSEDAFKYIDDITGQGSLNSHFRNLYNKISPLSKEQLDRIMSSSMFPVLKIDKSNRYDYYPELGISIFKKQIFDGDIANMKNIQELLYIKEEIIDMQIEDGKVYSKPEPYLVKFNDNGEVSLRLTDKANEFRAVNSKLFESLLAIELNSIGNYQGKIHDKATGENWHMLNNSAANNLFSNNNYFYNEQGDHIQIKNDAARCTEVAKINGLYLYRESNISYDGNRELCEKVLEHIRKNNTFNMFKPQMFVKLLGNIEIMKSVGYINVCFSEIAISEEVAKFVIKLLKQGILNGWTANILVEVIRYCSTNEYSLIYRANQNINYKVEQLILIDYKLLTDSHKKQVDEFYTNLIKMKQTIKDIIGEITVKGLREKSKALKSDETTKEFSKLCNNLIGHENKDLSSAGWEETTKWLKDANRLKELGDKIEQKLKKLDK